MDFCGELITNALGIDCEWKKKKKKKSLFGCIK